MLRTRIIDAAVVLVLAAGASWIAVAVLHDDEATVDGPVIAVAGWDGYPTAEVRGQLRLVDGCLLIDDAVVFWEEGTSWDAAHEAVEFEDADPVPVGAQFSGGGGYYMGGDVDGLDGVDHDAVEECLRRTGARDAVVATAHR
ncbi:hypothetical protein [Nocardioides aquiterrae]|uniref:Uncharacterized protein n=1 Tax=Nocardioides aquiterrae TaxID=203799 RepID=A0ABN1UFC9_9ACTN